MWIIQDYGTRNSKAANGIHTRPGWAGGRWSPTSGSIMNIYYHEAAGEDLCRHDWWRLHRLGVQSPV